MMKRSFPKLLAIISLEMHALRKGVFLCPKGRRFLSTKPMRMMKGLLTVYGLSVISICAVEKEDEQFSKTLQPILVKSCIKCHGKDGKVKGKVNLKDLTSTADFLGHPQLLEDLLVALEDGEMPPEDEPPLADKTRQLLITQFDALLKRSLAEMKFAATPIRRMNRFQYNNAVVDLLELDRDIFPLPEKLMRRYSDYFQPESGKLPASVKVASRPLMKDVDNARAEGFMGVGAFPQDLRAEHGYDNRADHLTLSPLLMESFLSLSQTIVDSSDLNPNECRSWNWLFAPPGETPIKKFEAENPAWLKVVGSPEGRVWVQDMKHFPSHWSGNKHLMWLCQKAESEMDLSFEAESAGDGLRIGFTKAPDYGSFELSLDGEILGEPFDLYDSKVSLAGEVTIPRKIAPGLHRLTIKCVGKNKKSKRFYFAMDTFEVTGLPKAKLKPVPVSDVEAVRARLTKLLRRAFRRPVDEEVLERFVAFAQKQLKAGDSFTEVMKTIVGAVFASPDFLYLYDVADGTKSGPQKLNDFELASRLSFFFWGSLPDDTLLDLAEAGKLSDPAILEKQIERMMNDRRLARFCDSFPGQWMQLDRLISSLPDQKKFKHFYHNTSYRVSMHMMLEPLLLFETVLIENRSVMDLLTPDFTWHSKALVGAYDGKLSSGTVNVLTFNRVPVTDPHRGGIITSAAILTMTSSPTRTLPITRGAWVNTVIFNDPPEPPPADVPPLPEVDEEALAKLTIRERFEAHRKRDDCAGCHRQIDPLGFALENFGPTGVWRDRYENGREIDSSGKIFGHDFVTDLDFRKMLVAEKGRFMRGFTAHLLSYALGRELTPADSPTLNDITKGALAGEDEMRTLLMKIALSEPFQHKNPESKSTGGKPHAE